MKQLFSKKSRSYSVQFDWDTEATNTISRDSKVKTIISTTSMKAKIYVTTIIIILQTKWRDLIVMFDLYTRQIWNYCWNQLHQFKIFATDTTIGSSSTSSKQINRQVKTVNNDVNTTLKPSLKPSLLQSINFDAYVKINVLQTILSTGVIIFQHLIIILFYYYYFQK